MSLTFNTIEVDSELVLAVGSTLVQPHFNMNSCSPDSLKLHFPHVKDLVPTALHLSFVIPEEGATWYLSTVNSSFFSSSEWSSLSSEFANSKSYIYIYVYIYIFYIYRIWDYHSFISSNRITQTSLIIPSMQDAIGRGYQCRASACGAMSAGKPWCSWSRPCLAITCAATGAGAAGRTWEMATVYIFSVVLFFFKPVRKSEMTLSWLRTFLVLKVAPRKVCLNKFLQHKIAVHKYFDYSNF